MAIILPNQALVLNAFAVLVDETPGNAALAEHVAFIEANGADAYKSALNSIFANSTDAELASSLLDNLGLGSVFTPEQAEAFIAANADNRVGAMIDLAGSLYNYNGSDADILAAQTDYVNSIDGSYNYSIDDSNTTGAALDGDLVSGDQTFTLTTGLDSFDGGLGNDIFRAINDDNGTGDITLSVGDHLDGGNGVDTLSVTVNDNALSLSGVDVLNIENLIVKNVDHNFDTLDVHGNAFDTVTLDYNGTVNDEDAYINNIDGQTTLTIENVDAGDYTFYRNDDEDVDFTEGTVSVTNTLQNWDISTYDIFFYGYENFALATTINHTLNITDVDNSIPGDNYGYGVDIEDNISSDTDGSVINSTVNIDGLVIEDDTHDEAGYVSVIGENTAGESTYNFTVNISDSDGVNTNFVAGNSGTEDVITYNVDNHLNTHNHSALWSVNFETINLNVTGDSEFTYFGDDGDTADTDLTVNIVADADFTVTSISEFGTGNTADVTLTVTGSGDVDLNETRLGDGAADDVVTVDASALTGDFTIDETYGYAASITTGTGDDTVTVASSTTVVTLDAGDDSLTVEEAIAVDSTGTTDVVDASLAGGAGTDSFTISAADALLSETAVDASADDIALTDAITGFEKLSLTSVHTEAIDAIAWGLADDVTIDGYTTGGSLTVNDAAHVTVTGAGTTDYAIIVDGADAVGSDADSVSIAIAAQGTTDDTNDGLGLVALTVADVETLNISSTSADDATELLVDAPTENDTNTVDLVAATATTLNITGDTALVFADSHLDLTAVETVNAASFDAGLTISVATSAEDVTITTGAGDDVVTGNAQDDTISVGDGDNTVDAGDGDNVVTSGAGSDMITTGTGDDSISVGDGGSHITAGAGLDTIALGSAATMDDVDTLYFAAVTDSQGVTVDVITGFQVDVQTTDDVNDDGVVDSDDGVVNDVLDFSAIVPSATASYAGEADGYGAVLTSLTAGESVAVLDSASSILYYDVDADGSLTDADMAVQLTGVTGLSDLNFVFGEVAA